MDTERSPLSRSSPDAGTPFSEPGPFSPSFACPPRPIWPAIVGILSVLQGLFWVSCIGFGIAMRTAYPMQAEPSPEGWWGVARLPVGILAVLLPILAVVAGVQSIRRRPSARVLHIVYGVLGVLVYGAAVARVAISTYASHSENSMLSAYVGGTALVVAIFMGYPAFALIWFLRPKIRQQVAAWAPTEPVVDGLARMGLPEDIAHAGWPLQEDTAPPPQAQGAGQPAMESGAGAADEPVFTQAQVADMQERQRLEKRFLSGARWFYWIAGLSIATSVIALTGGTWGFAIALGITQFITAIGAGLAEQLGPAAKYVTFAMAVLVSLLFAGFGYLSRNRYRWAHITGMVFYALDGLLCLAFQDWLGAGFHAFVLLGLYGGLKAHAELKRFDAAFGSSVPRTAAPAEGKVPPPPE